MGIVEEGNPWIPIICIQIKTRAAGIFFYSPIVK